MASNLPTSASTAPIDAEFGDSLKKSVVSDNQSVKPDRSLNGSSEPATKVRTHPSNLFLPQLPSIDFIFVFMQ